MPFTFAHPAAVLPLRRSRYLQTVPLVIGSMVPDLPYFVPDRLGQLIPETHTAYGSFAVCLPLGMAVLLLTLLLRDPLTVLLGARARWVLLRALDRFTERHMHWPIALLSVFVGTWTHLAWDSITHQNGWTAEQIPALNETVTILGWSTELSHLLQYVSSVFGLTVLAIWFRGLLAKAPDAIVADPAQPRARWFLLAAIVVIAIYIGIDRSLWAFHLGNYYRTAYLFSTRAVRWFWFFYLSAGIIVMLSRRVEFQPAR